MDYLKRDYVICKILLKEIKVYADRVFIEEFRNKVEDPADKNVIMSVFIRGLCTQLNSFNELLKKNVFNDYSKDDVDLVQSSRELKKELEFINHLRDHMCAHIDENTIEKLVQWEPTIFNKAFLEIENAQEYFIYKSMLETGINSYLDEDGKQKVFNQEIDLFINHDNEMFMGYLSSVTDKVIDYLWVIKNKINEKIEYFNIPQTNPHEEIKFLEHLKTILSKETYLYEMDKDKEAEQIHKELEEELRNSNHYHKLFEEAGKTDFRLKKKGR